MSTRNRPVATDREREGVRAREIARQASRGVGWGGTKSRTFVLRAPRRRVRGGEGEEGKEERGRGRDSYSRAEGPPAIIFKPLQPTLELVEIKHRITGISASVPATRTPQTDRQDTQTDGRTNGQTGIHYNKQP